MRADLHVHSTASDGTESPSSLVALALERGLSVLAIADHDSVEGVAEARGAAAGTDLKVVPAVELSSVSPSGDDIHILGYFIDPQDPHLLAHLQDLREARLRRARTMVDVLNGAGYQLGLADVLTLSQGGAVGRSHVARALVAAGHADTIADAFQRLIGRDRPYYVSKDVRTPEEAIACIRESGGLAVIAHPGISRTDHLIEPLIAHGLAGIEAFHADHSSEQRAYYAAMAHDFGVLATGGSDFHGHRAPNPALGSVDIPVAAVEAFLAAEPL